MLPIGGASPYLRSHRVRRPFLDLSTHTGAWEVLDEGELATMASAEDAALAREARAEVERLIAAQDPLFDPRSHLWDVPPGALGLAALGAPDLV